MRIGFTPKTPVDQPDNYIKRVEFCFDRADAIPFYSLVDTHYVFGTEHFIDLFDCKEKIPITTSKIYLT